MNPKSVVFVLVLLLSAAVPAYPQFEIYIPISINEKDADANGYYNPHNNTFILEQQNKGIITRLLYDTSFNLKQKYTVKADSISFSTSGKRPFFLKEYCTVDNVYEIYGNRKQVEVWQLDFVNGIEKKMASLPLQEYYKDEKLIAIIPGETKLSFLSFSSKQKKILLYNFFPGKNFLLQREYILPERPLTKEEIKEHGKFLSVDYSDALSGLYVSDLQKPSRFQVSPANQLLYNDTAIYILAKVPFKAGIHLLELNRITGSVSFKNFLVNTLVPGKFGSALEKIPMATALDSLLVIQNSSAAVLEYYLYSLRTKELLVKHEAAGDNSLYKLIQSDLRQVGTYASKDEAKEITNERLFLRRKNKGMLFLKAAKADNDSLLLTFGSYNPTEGIDGTVLSYITMQISGFLLAPAGIFGVLPYLTVSRNKFLFAYSKFSMKTLEPSPARGITTALDTIASDRRTDDLERKSSFVIEKNERLYIGIFDKEKNKYNIIVY